ncbi:hypothetical protein DUNSADRAFT_18657 [Dunaliella salina]|uniref:Encoded protein n=1 Tax=Dunaliella salina TaxID=3046 RepID=A0ABQ7GYY4_DUNSA|nr:hypothetical protein DUNSADRAFT_18657 [Dunaliella salina]|eukprot:KAF5839779.1 hypothetical protein DUNSADRAFT_18657 [Dunaliella salina]
MHRIQTKATRKKLEWFKYSLYVAFPLVFGYGLGRIPNFWERVAEVFPSAAANPKGPYLDKEVTSHRPSLQSEYQNLALEAALDSALADARRRSSNRAQQQQQQQEQPK